MINSEQKLYVQGSRREMPLRASQKAPPCLLPPMMPICDMSLDMYTM